MFPVFEHLSNRITLCQIDKYVRMKHIRLKLNCGKNIFRKFSRGNGELGSLVTSLAALWAVLGEI